MAGQICCMLILCVIYTGTSAKVMYDVTFPWTDSFRFIRPGETTLLSSGYLDMDYGNSCYEEHLFLWTDDTFVLDLAMTNSKFVPVYYEDGGRVVYNSSSFENIGLGIHHRVLLSNAPTEINVNIFGSSKEMLNGRLMINVFMELKGDVSSEQIDYWKLFLWHLHIWWDRDPLKSGRTHRIIDTFYIATHPLKQDMELNIYNHILAKHHGGYNVSLQMLRLQRRCPDDKRSSDVSLIRKNMIDFECFLGDDQIDMNDVSKYNVYFGFESDISKTDCWTVDLHITNFTIQDIGKYSCDLKLFNNLPEKVPSEIRTNTATIVPKFDSASYPNRSDFIRTPHLHKSFMSDTMNMFHNHVSHEVTTLKDWRESYQTVKDKIKSAWIEVLIITATSIVILFFTLYPEYKIRKNKRIALKQLKALQRVEKNEDIDQVYKYDLFISYDRKDENFVRDEVHDKLEQIGYKVCFDCRDFDFGSSRVYSSGYAIEHSRRTIAVFSPNYYRNSWSTEFEFTSIYTGILNREGPTDRLVIIKYLECKIPDILLQHTYLDWTDTKRQSLFIERLVKSIGPPFVKQLELANNECATASNEQENDSELFSQ